MMAEWRDATVLGSIYEQQVDARSGHWRHRQALNIPPVFQRTAWDRMEQHPDEGWKRGAAPDG